MQGGRKARRGLGAGRATPRTVVDGVPCWGKPRAARRVAPGTGRSGDAAYLQERQRSAEPLEGAEGWQEAVARAERSGAGAFRMAPWGAARGGKAQRLFERVAEPTGGRHVAC